MQMAEVHWKSEATGETGHGSPLALTEARARLAEAEATTPSITHWLVEVDDAGAGS